MRKSTDGWQICVQWKDGSTSWKYLKDLKDSHPVQTADYDVAQGIDHEPGFNWWVDVVLRKREIFISLVKKRNAWYLKKTHKFGVEFPKSVTEAYALYKHKGNTHWENSIAKEMKDVKPVFRIMEDSERVPIGFHSINCHMIFDVKMEDFRRKSRLVACGHTSKPPEKSHTQVLFSVRLVE